MKSNFLTKSFLLTNSLLLLLQSKLINGEPYHYYLLAMQNWCESPKSHYQIHGLWPQYNATAWPENCVGSPYVEISDSQLLDEMYANWENCNNPESSLWSHEYSKHLTCIMAQYPNKYTQNELFQLTIDLFQSINYNDFCFNGESDCNACYDLDFHLINCPE